MDFWIVSRDDNKDIYKISYRIISRCKTFGIVQSYKHFNDEFTIWILNKVHKYHHNAHLLYAHILARKMFPCHLCETSNFTPQVIVEEYPMHTQTHTHIYVHRFNYAMLRNCENIFTWSILRKMELSAIQMENFWIA